MEQTEQELLRKTLMSIVKRIESSSSPTVMMSGGLDQGSDSAEPPVVLILLGQAGSTNDKVSENQASHEAKPSGKTGSDMSHPGFERFKLADARAADAPKTCFMEPDRICVNSGACEMLGH